MTDAISSFGTLMQIGDGGAPEAFATIAEVLDINGITIKQNSEDATNHSSPGGWEEAIGTTLAMGPVKFGVNFQPTHPTHSYAAGLVKDAVNHTKRHFRLIFPDPTTTTWAFTALVDTVDAKAPVKGKLAADITLKITGQPTLE